MTLGQLIQLASLGGGVVQNPAGAVVSNEHGTIVLHGTSTPVTIYSDEMGTTQNTQGTFVTDEFGRIPGWIQPGQAIDITASPAPVSTIVFSTIAVDGGSSSSSSMDTVDGGSSAGN